MTPDVLVLLVTVPLGIVTLAVLGVAADEALHPARWARVRAAIRRGARR